VSVVVAVVVGQSVHGGGGGGNLPGLSTSPAITGRVRVRTIREMENKRLMQASVSGKNQGSIADTKVSMPVGEEYKDYWARLARDGDLWACNKLARCYERTGELKDGLVVVEDLLARENLPGDLKVEALLTKAVLQKDSPTVAWKTIAQASIEVEPELRSRLHNQRGRILSDLKKFDRAIIEYTATAYYAELAGSPEMVGLANNNLASIYRRKKLFSEAHEAVDRAIDLWRDYDYLPQAIDQKALIHIDEKEYGKARALVLRALSYTAETHRWTAEFLCTLSKSEAGLSAFAESLMAIERALKICDFLGDENLRLRVAVARKESCELMYQASDRYAVRLAMTLTDGKLRQAAKKLGINHNALRKAVSKHSIATRPPVKL
jgi:tetratricopeptide (TPR) repeat protein